MKKLLALAVLVAGCAHASAATDTSKARTPVGSALAYAVTFESAGGTVYCSGAVVEGLVLTAGHCAAAKGEVFIRWAGRRYTSTEIHMYPEQDLAMVHVEGLPEGLRLAHTAPKYGAEVFVVGSPLGILEQNVGFGHVAHPGRSLDLGCDRHTCFPNPHLMVDIIIAGGSSGSPVLNSVGDVVGVISFGFGGGWSLGGAVPLETIKLMKNRIQ